MLVTRPAGRADELLTRLHEQGADTLHIPFLDIAALNPEEDAVTLQASRQCVLELDRYQKLIFISANAVDYGVDLVEQFWPQWPIAQTIYAIGRATAGALAAKGLHAVAAEGSMDSESLLAHADLRQVAGQRVAIFRGLGGRETLASVLTERGARVDYIECYRRSAPRLNVDETLRRLDAFAPQVVVVNSGETLQHLSKLLAPGHDLFQRYLVVPGARVAALAANLGYAKTIPADNAGTAATLAALQTIMTATDS